MNPFIFQAVLITLAGIYHQYKQTINTHTVGETKERKTRKIILLSYRQIERSKLYSLTSGVLKHTANFIAPCSNFLVHKSFPWNTAFLLSWSHLPLCERFGTSSRFLLMFLLGVFFCPLERSYGRQVLQKKI